MKNKNQSFALIKHLLFLSNILLIPVVSLAAPASTAITMTLPTSTCGNARVETTEACDDGNRVSGDGCSTNCQTETLWYQDNDGDGRGNPAVTQYSATPPPGYVPIAQDCNDNEIRAYRGAVESCDSVDNDCDGMIDEGVQTTYYQDADGDTYGNLAMTTKACSVPAGYSVNAQDCNDADARIYRGAIESCDELDNDCDGLTDEGVQTIYYQDLDGDTYGNATITIHACSVPAGYSVNAQDCNDTVVTIYTGAQETCDSIDNDCDGVIDEGVQTTYYQDIDGDGYGLTDSTMQACSRPSGYSTSSGDCDDTSNLIYPNQTEEFGDGIDNDCDGTDSISLTQSIDTVGNVGTYTSIALDSSGKIHISYYDVTNGDLKYATNSSGSWVMSTVDSANNVGSYSSIVIDDGNDIHISYFDSTNSSIKYAYNENGNTAWDVKTLNDSDDAVGPLAMVFSEHDQIHIAYYQRDGSDYRLMYSKFEGGEDSDDWLEVIQSETSYLSMVSTEYHGICISYGHTEASDEFAVVCEPEQDLNQDFEVEDSSGIYMSLIAGDNEAYIWSTFVSTNHQLLSCGNDFEDCVVVDDSGIQTTYNSLASSGNYIHISYYDSSNNDLKYAGEYWQLTTYITGYGSESVYFSHSCCSTYTIDSNGDVGSYTDIIVNAEHGAELSVFISYYDATNGDLKFASITDCGDSTVSGNETCDDGNYLSGDGCSSTCQSEVTVVIE